MCHGVVCVSVNGMHAQARAHLASCPPCPPNRLRHTYTHPLICLVQLVGSVLAEDAKPLPAELDSFLNQGLAANQGQGAVLASLGTLALLTEHEVRSIAQGLCALDIHVLWKLDTQQLPGILCHKGFRWSVLAQLSFHLHTYTVMSGNACVNQVCADH